MTPGIEEEAPICIRSSVRTGDYDTEQVKSAVADAPEDAWQYVSVKLLSLFLDQYYFHFYIQIRLMKEGIDCTEKFRDRNKEKVMTCVY
jgi:hypothetical protein